MSDFIYCAKCDTLEGLDNALYGSYLDLTDKEKLDLKIDDSLMYCMSCVISIESKEE